MIKAPRIEFKEKLNGVNELTFTFLQSAADSCALVVASPHLPPTFTDAHMHTILMPQYPCIPYRVYQ